MALAMDFIEAETGKYMFLHSEMKDRFHNIDVVGSGYATNKGIEVGMTIQDLTNAYGNIYPSEGFWEKHRNEEDAGMMSSVKDNPQYSRSYSHYYFVSFGHWIATPTYWLGGMAMRSGFLSS
jgi:hypothetical protein